MKGRPRGKKEKTRNSSQWTEARFEGFIRSALRQASTRWPPRYQVLGDAFTRVKTNKKSGRKAKHFRCATCKGEFPQKEVSVDHTKPIGSTKSWDKYIEALFCEKDNLQVLCKPCHKDKTNKEAKGR